MLSDVNAAVFVDYATRYLFKVLGGLYPIIIDTRWLIFFWRYIAIIALVASVVLSFLWRWWTFIPGVVLCMMILNANKQSTVDFAVEILENNKDAYAAWAKLGLIWDAPLQSLVPDNT